MSEQDTDMEVRLVEARAVYSTMREQFVRAEHWIKTENSVE